MKGKNYLQKKLFFFLTLIVITLLATTIYALEAITTSKYIVKNDVIMRIDAGTTVEQFLNNVGVNSGASKAVYRGSTQLNGSDLLGTGMTLKVGNDTTYNLAVRGDANGDSKITATDLSLFKIHTTNIQLLEGIYEKAIDINCDLKVSMVDLSLLKMVLVGLPLPDNDLPNINGDITILPTTTNYVKELDINVYWPEDTTGLTKQISLDNGATYSNYTGNVTMRANSTVIARLVDQNSRVVKSASLVVTNIDNEAPANFEVAVEHKITNYTTLTGETTDAISGLAGYHFTYNAGQSWAPAAGQLSGKFVFTNVPANTRINLQMKATDRVGNYTLTNTVEKRTFKNGIDILAEKMQGVAVDTETQAITMPDGKVFRLAITEEGGYKIISLGTETDLAAQLAEENLLNQKIAEYEVNGAILPNEILTRLTEEGFGKGTLEDQMFTTEKEESYIQYMLKTNITGKHQMMFLKTITKNALTSSGQIEENETLIALEDLIIEMKDETQNLKIIDILDRAIQEDILLEENVNRNNGRFETEVGLTYEVREDEGVYTVDLIGFAEDVEAGYIQSKILSILVEGLKNQIIDWAIEDGLTTEEKASRTNGMYQANNGAYKQVVIDTQRGNYDTIQIDKVEGAIIEYTLTPDFPTMTNKTVLNITARGTTGITKIEAYTELGEALLEKTYTDNQLTKSEDIDITYNGTYLVIVTTSDGKVSEKEILVSNIASILPIRVSIIPESPRNTTKTEPQNGVETGPITVKLKFSEAPLLENADKYQYQLYATTGTWQTATREQTIENITKNCKIYARYFDGTKSIKQVEIVIDTVDNIAPDAFNFTTKKTSNTITVEATTTDTARDSDGTTARTGVEGIGQYLYKLGDGDWQQNNIFENLTQQTDYTIMVKAIDYAGNETSATNNGATIATDVVPSANSTISFDYSTTLLTKENVLVKFISTLPDETYTIQYQPISDGSQPVADRWISDEEYEATGNCKIYVRLVDSTNQENPGKNYAIGEVTNIDNMGPIAFTPKATATTKNSITIKASSVGTGEANDTPESNTTACSGTVKYDYYITGTAGMTTKIENQTNYTYTFTGLEQGSLYSIYVIATDAVGNATVSENITVVTNGTLNEFTNAHTTITGLIEDATYDNPIIPVGFAPVNEGGAEWGNGTTKPSGWDDGLVIRDRDGNEFVWIPVNGTDVTYSKWLTEGISHTGVTDGQNVLVNGEEYTEGAQIDKYKGFYILRTEASKNETVPMGKVGEKPWAGNNYANAKEKAESMYSSNLLQSVLVTGTQWDTLMKWISLDDEDILTSEENGNFTGERKDTGSSETYKIKNIYDLSGNVQEITNELQGNNVVVRGGAYDLEKNLKERYTFSQEYANSNLGFRTVLYVIETDELEPTNPGALGIGNINKGPGNITINGGQPSNLNPVVPVGFKAINTEDAKWFGLPTPKDWNKGLVIEDVDGNQFVWIPVDGNKIKYQKWYSIYAPSSVKGGDIAGDLLPLALEELNVTEQQQINTYGGFYVARYEAGNFEGMLASKAGTKTVSAVTYSEAREYAEAMYANPYVKSGLLTGTAWDTTMSWMAAVKGTNKVLNDKISGNNPEISFTFSGEYAAGPETTLEVRGEYQNGTDVTKPRGQRMLLATGLVENFKINNIYDMAGNVWEYTYEYTLNKKGEREYIARGADYYRKYSTSAKWGAAIRENIVTTVAEKRNEGGFRVMLYLVEGTAEVGKYEDFNRTMTGKPSTYDNPVVPAGFAPVNKGASWGNGTKETIEWNNGLVIDDQAGNEFVWVPVDRTNVEYKNWLQTGISYKEVDGQEIPEKVTGWNEKEITQINKYGGFYIARYEASRLTTETETTGGSIANAETWTNLDYITAKSMAEKMKTKDNVSAGLVTGTAWDTTMKWIANEKGNASYVAENSTSWGYYSNSTLGKNAQAKNIFLLAGGNWEWTAEKVGDNAVYRGGVRTDRGDSSPAGYRGTKGTTTIDEGTTFRMMLYVTGDVVGAVTKPVSEAEALPGTAFPSTINVPILSQGMTPIKHNGTTWVTTTADDPNWYSYVDSSTAVGATSKWANARTPDGSMWVWIPRYAYKIESQTQTIKVLFLRDKTNEPIEITEDVVYARAINGITTSNNYVVHPAFISDPTLGGWDKELPGIWVGKFETSGDSPITLGSKPYAASFGYDSQGSAQFLYARQATLGLGQNERQQIDVHMAKNSEWGAAAYLAHSAYGVNGQQIQPSDSESAGYQYEINTNQSTTFNVYGIYDMAGGRLEYASAYVGDMNAARFGNLGAISTSELKYKQIYGPIYTYDNYNNLTYYEYKNLERTLGPNDKLILNNGYSSIYDMRSPLINRNYDDDYEPCYNVTIKRLYRPAYNYYGDALGEVSGWQGSTSYSPEDYTRIIDHGTPRPLYVRGMIEARGIAGGAKTIFTTSVQCSNTNYAYSFRMIIVNLD